MSSKRKGSPTDAAQTAEKKHEGEQKIVKVGILGATGTVGQRFIQMLSTHPYFKIQQLGASSRSAGKAYQKAVQWKLTTAIPDDVKEMVVSGCEVDDYKECSVIFSALDNVIAGPIEEAFAKQGFKVFSNAKNHRYDADVPILIPHANADHLKILPHQQKSRGYDKGFIITNANCSSTGLCIALAPLLEKFGLEKVFIVTLQAISGSGYPGVPSLDIIDNVIPHIGGEEPKLQAEPLKVLGKCSETGFTDETFTVSAMCNRVNVIDGHTECVSVKLSKKATLEEVKAAFANHTSEAQGLKLPSAPPAPIVVMEEENRPQPRLDRNLHGGYVCSVGRVRPCPLFDFKFTLLSHNTVIGAAGGSILNAELCYAKGMLN